MQISLTGHHFSISDRIRSYVDQAGSRLERYYTPLLGCRVTLRQDARLYKATVSVQLEGESLVATEEADRVYAAIDAAMSKMVSQLKRLHGKRRSHRPESATAPLEPAAEE